MLSWEAKEADKKNKLLPKLFVWSVKNADVCSQQELTFNELLKNGTQAYSYGSVLLPPDSPLHNTVVCH